MDNLGMFVDYLILYMYPFSNDTAGKHDTVFNHSALFDDAAPADDGILNGSLYHTSVWDYGAVDYRGIKVVGGTGIVRAGINRPVLMEKITGGFVIDQLHIGIIIAVEICDGGEISPVRHAPYILSLIHI